MDHDGPKVEAACTPALKRGQRQRRVEQSDSAPGQLLRGRRRALSPAPVSVCLRVYARARQLFKSNLQNKIKRWASKCQCLAPFSSPPLQ